MLQDERTSHNRQFPKLRIDECCMTLRELPGRYVKDRIIFVQSDKKEFNYRGIFMKNIIVFIIIVLTVVCFGVPLFIDYFIFGNTFISNLTNGEWASFLGSYLGGIIGGGATLLTIFISIKYAEKQRTKDRKIDNRVYLMFDEIDNLGLKLEGYNYRGESDIRIIETENYTEFENLAKEKSFSNIRLNYFMIRNEGPNVVTSCEITLKIVNDSSRETIIKSTIPIIRVNQEYFILAQSMILYPAPQLLKEVEIKYFTVLGEEMKYTYYVDKKGDGSSCLEKYFVKEDGAFKELFNTSTNNVSWVYIKHNRTLYK